MIENHRDSFHESLQNGSITVSEAEIGDGNGEQIICGPGIQVVGLATNQNGETIFIVPNPKQESPVMVLGPDVAEMTHGSESVTIKDITHGHHDSQQQVIIRNPPSSSSFSTAEMEESSEQKLIPVTSSTHQPTLIVVSNSDPPTNPLLVGGINESDERPKRKAALKAIAARKAAKKKRAKLNAPKVEESKEGEESGLKPNQEVITEDDNGKENNDPSSGKEPTLSSSLPNDCPADISKIDFDDDSVTTDDDDESKFRRCIVCLKRQRFTEDIFDSSKQLYYHIDVLIAHLNIQVT
jgi:hypothetical protein